MPRQVHRAARLAWIGLAALACAAIRAADGNLRPIGEPDGYVARLLINEVPFPGERYWLSEEDSRAAMRQVLLVLDARLRDVPRPYTQRQVASVRTDNLIDLITAGGVHGQVEGFYRDEGGRPVVVARVSERVENLVRIAGKGAPGRFLRLLAYAQEISSACLARKDVGADIYRSLRMVEEVPVTGRAYSWMTDLGMFNPGGNYVRITDELRGGLGGNRFFTLRRLAQ
jgi:hypothetical protein